MNRSANKTMHTTLLGLLVAFLFSAVVAPMISLEPEADAYGQYQIQATHLKASVGIPLTWAEEEKEEEESRSDKDQFAAIAVLPIELDWLATWNSPTTWAFNHTNTSALTEFPVYLAKQSLLI